MKVNLALLASIGASDDEGLAAAWASDFPCHVMAEFEHDIPAVVAALLDTPLPALGGPLRTVLPYGPAEQNRVAGSACRPDRQHGSEPQHDLPGGAGRSGHVVLHRP